MFSESDIIRNKGSTFNPSRYLCVSTTEMIHAAKKRKVKSSKGSPVCAFVFSENNMKGPHFTQVDIPAYP